LIKNNFCSILKSLENLYFYNLLNKMNYYLIFILTPIVFIFLSSVDQVIFIDLLS